jgi:microcystin-dependent protein
MSIRISQLPQETNPATTDWVPVVVNGITRKTFLSSVADLVTGGTVTNITAGQNVSVSSNPSNLSKTISFHLPGMIVPFAGAVARIPEGWLLCDGRPVSRSEYADLFSVLSTRFGSGDNLTTFNLPDLRGRIPFGVSQTPASPSPLISHLSPATPNYHTLGAHGGQENHPLTFSQTPVRPHTHTGSGKMRVFGGPAAWFFKGDCSPPGSYGGNGFPGSVSGDGTSLTASDTRNTNAFAGVLAQPHNNMPPTMVVNYLIRH